MSAEAVAEAPAAEGDGGAPAEPVAEAEAAPADGDKAEAPAEVPEAAPVATEEQAPPAAAEAPPQAAEEGTPEQAPAAPGEAPAAAGEAPAAPAPAEEVAPAAVGEAPPAAPVDEETQRATSTQMVKDLLSVALKDAEGIHKTVTIEGEVKKESMEKLDEQFPKERVSTIEEPGAVKPAAVPSEIKKDSLASRERKSKFSMAKVPKVIIYSAFFL